MIQEIWKKTVIETVSSMVRNLEQEEIETYNQDREQFFENELEEAAEKEKEESTDFAMAFTAIIAVLILCLMVIGYRGRKNR